MLVLSRRVGEEIRIGDATVRILEVRGGRVRLGVDAPPEVSITRPDATAKGVRDGDAAERPAGREGHP